MIRIIDSLLAQSLDRQNRVWCAERGIKKGDRPDLKARREERLTHLRMTLTEINRMINEYEGTDTGTT